jgi:TRAP-type C4-dicarboxylate transport system permease small subunit
VNRPAARQAGFVAGDPQTEKEADILLRQIFRATERVIDVILFILFSITFFTVLIQVVSRFIPSLVVPWTEEVTRLSFVYIICFGAPLAIKYNEYARVDILFNVVPLRVRLFLECFSTVIVTAFCLVVGITSFPLVELGKRQLSVYMQIPMYFAFASITFCFFFSFVAGVFRTIDTICDFVHPDRVLRREKEAAEALQKENEEEAELIRSAALKNDGGDVK